MRLQLSGLALLALAGTAAADTHFTSKLQVYADSDHTTVVSPLVKASAGITPTTEIGAGYVADVISSASIDVVSQASKTTIHDVRHQASLDVSHILSGNTWTLAGGYIFSHENDYDSHSVSASVEHRMNDNNTTLSLGWGGAFNDVQRSGDSNFHRSLINNDLALVWTQIVNQTLATQVTLASGLSSGYQASPYRFVAVKDPDLQPLFWVAETDPDRRIKGSLVAGANLHVFEDSSLQADYRVYGDDWGIVSHTIQLRYLVNFGDHTELRLRERYYSQSSSSFYRQSYFETKQFMTGDRELSPLWSETFGAKLTRRIGKLDLEAKADVFYYQYAKFRLLPSRTGANVGLGATLNY